MREVERLIIIILRLKGKAWIRNKIPPMYIYRQKNAQLIGKSSEPKGGCQYYVIPKSIPINPVLI